MGTRHPKTIAPPPLITHPNGTYDWSYGLQLLIRQPSCHSSSIPIPFMSQHSTVARSVRCFSNLHVPAAPCPPICHPVVDALGEIRTHQLFRAPSTSNAAEDIGFRDLGFWRLGVWRYWSIVVAGWAFFIYNKKYLLSILFPGKGYDGDWTLFILSYVSFTTSAGT